MLAKELFVARWRIILCTLIVVAAALFEARTRLTYVESYQTELSRGNVTLWSDPYTLWFTGIGLDVLSLVAAILGAELIGGEVSKGTIGLLLSRPISRDRILVTKYLSSAAVLLGLTLLSSAILSATFRLGGFAPPVAEVLRGTLYLWCIKLSILALALVFSAIFKDAIVPFLLTVLGVISFFILDRLVLWVALTPYETWRSNDLESYITWRVIGHTYAAWSALMLAAAGLLLGAALLLFRRRAF